MAGPPGLEQTRRSPTAGLVSDPESGRRVQAARYQPREALAGVVDRLWSGAWDLRGQAPHHVQLLADPTVHLVFEAGRSRVVGVCRGLFRRRLAGRGRLRAVALAPGGAHALGLGPAQHWTDRVVPLAEGWPELAALEPQILASPSDEEALSRLAGWLEARVGATRRSEVYELLRDMRVDPALCRVEAVAAHAGVSVRSLQRRFRADVGASPKWVLQRYRLQEAVRRIDESGHALSDVAYALGYADQAHLTREFRRAVGVAPSVFRRERSTATPPGSARSSG